MGSQNILFSMDFCQCQIKSSKWKITSIRLICLMTSHIEEISVVSHIYKLSWVDVQENFSRGCRQKQKQHSRMSKYSKAYRSAGVGMHVIQDIKTFPLSGFKRKEAKWEKWTDKTKAASTTHNCKIYTCWQTNMILIWYHTHIHKTCTCSHI